MTPASVSCEDARTKFPLYLKGSLSLQQTQQIFSHLKRCVPCRAAADGQQVIEHEHLLERLKRAGVGFGIALAVIGLTLLFWQPTPPAISSTNSMPKIQPGMAYYTRLHVEDRTQTQEALKQILSGESALEVTGPYSGRYYLMFTSKQLSVFMKKLTQIGTAQTATVGKKRWDEGPAMPEACSLTLDLVATAT